MRRILAAPGLCIALFPLLVGDVSASEGAPETGRWRLRPCSFERCAPGPARPGSAVGFAVAVLAAGWVGRRAMPPAG